MSASAGPLLAACLRPAEKPDYNFEYSKSKPTTGMPIYPILGLRGEF
jgi:hypothetical protein